MTGEQCPVQMFRVGRHVYATQFHPEGDCAGFRLRIEAYKHHGYFKPHEADDLVQRVCERETPYAQEILRRFVAHYALD
jgi:GMP synthase (glutamine-hydrolysing)